MSEDSAVQSNAESMQEKPCSSSCTGDTPGAVMEEAKQLLGAGNRHLVMGDVVSAVAVFQEACGMLAKEYGDTAYECGEAFFLCGKSLLELARMENGVLGNALDGVPEEETDDGEKPDDSKIESADNLDEETRDDLRVQVYDAMAEKEGEKSEAEKGEQKSKDQVTQDGNVDQSPDEGGAGELPQKGAGNGSPPDGRGAGNGSPPDGRGAAEPTNGKSAAVQNSEGSEMKEGEETADEEMEEGGEEEGEDDNDGEGTTEDKDSEEEEVGNLQLAWEMLEVAKVIYKRKGNRDDQLLAAQTHLKLGEVSAESGNYSQALEDFQECLALQLKSLPSHSRLLAETHYQLGLTFGYTGQYSLAIQHFSSSVEVIESRLVMLREAVDEAKAEGATEERREMEELQQLLPDIQEKVEDAKESRATVVLQQTLPAGSSGLPAESEGTSPAVVRGLEKTMPADGVSSSSVSDISHLVRKKRKPEESPLKDSDPKKAKQQNGGDTSVCSGVQETAEAREEPVKPANPMETSA